MILIRHMRAVKRRNKHLKDRKVFNNKGTKKSKFILK